MLRDTLKGGDISAKLFLMFFTRSPISKVGSRISKKEPRIHANGRELKNAY